MYLPVPAQPFVSGRTFEQEFVCIENAISPTLPVMIACASSRSRSGLDPLVNHLDTRWRLESMTACVQDFSQATLCFDLGIIAGDMRHFKGKGQCVGIILRWYRRSLRRRDAGSCQRPKHLRFYFVNGHEVFGARLCGRDNEIYHCRENEQCRRE